MKKIPATATTDDSSSSSSSSSSSDSSSSDEEEVSYSPVANKSKTMKPGLKPATISPPASPPLNRGVAQLGTKMSPPLPTSTNKNDKPGFQPKEKSPPLSNPFLKKQDTAPPKHNGLGMLTPKKAEADGDSSDEDDILGPSPGALGKINSKVPPTGKLSKELSKDNSSKVTGSPPSERSMAKGSVDDDKNEKSKKSSSSKQEKKKESKDKKEKKEKKEKEKKEKKIKKDEDDGERDKSKNKSEIEQKGKTEEVGSKVDRRPSLIGDKSRAVDLEGGHEGDKIRGEDDASSKEEKRRGFLGRLFAPQKAEPPVVVDEDDDAPEDADPVVNTKKNSGRFSVFRKKSQKPEPTDDDIEIEFVPNDEEEETAITDKAVLHHAPQMESAPPSTDIENPASIDQNSGKEHQRQKLDDQFKWVRLYFALLIFAILIVGSTVGTAFWGMKIYTDKHGDSELSTDSGPPPTLEGNECDYDDNILLEFRILFDSKPEQTGFSLRDAPPFSSGIWVMEPGTFRSFSQFQKKNTLRICLSDKLNYTFEIEDMFGDGMVSEFGATSVYGRWELAFNEHLVASYNGDCYANATSEGESLSHFTNGTLSFVEDIVRVRSLLESMKQKEDARPPAEEPEGTDPPSETTGPAGASTTAPSAAIADGGSTSPPTIASLDGTSTSPPTAVAGSSTPPPTAAAAGGGGLLTLAPSAAGAISTIVPTAAATAAQTVPGGTEPPLVLGRSRGDP